MEKMLNNYNQNLKKHVATIHCSNSLSLLQRKISNALLYHAYHQLLETEIHQISIAYLCKLIGYNGNNHSKIKEAIRALISTLIEWNLVDDCGGEDWTACSMLAGVRFKSGQCYYSYYVGLRELLHSPTIYGRINLIIQARFNSNYGLALYENCARYIGLSQTKDFDIDIFRRLMGIPDDKYQIFRDLKRRVLDKAVDEVNTHSDIHIEPIVKRSGKKVVSIQFKLDIRAKKRRLGDETLVSTEIPHANDLAIRLFQVMVTDFGVGRQSARDLIQFYSIEFINEKIDLIKSSDAYVKGTIKNLAGYFLDAIKNDYKKNNSTVEIAYQKSQNEWRQSVETSQKNKLEQQERRKYDEFTDKEILDQLIMLADNDKENVINLFIKILPQIFINKYQKEGFSNKACLALFKSFVLERFPDDFKMTSFEEFRLREDSKFLM